MQLREVLVNPIPEDDEYIEFLEWANSIQGDQIDEGLIPSGLKKKFEFIKKLAVGMKVKIKDLITLFKNSKVFKFFKNIKFSMAKLHALLKKGFKVYQDFLTAIGDFIAKTPAGQWTEQKLKALDGFLQRHPKTKRIAGIAVAAVLVYIWFNMTFTGDPAFDFGMDDLLAALAGKFKLSTLFAGPQGIKLLLLFATGAIGLTFPWPGPSKIQFAVGVAQTLAKKVKVRLSRDNKPLGSIKQTSLRENKKSPNPFKIRMELEERILREQKENRAVILILTKDEESLGETGEAIKEYCDGHNIKCHLVFSDMAFISSRENDKNLIIHNFNGEGKKIALSPTDTACFVRGGIFDDESGMTFLKAIERTGVFMINPSKVMELSRNKLLSSLHFEKNNILTPRSTLINNEDTIDLALKKIGNKFPIIVKTVSGSEGIGVIKVESRETLTSILQALWEQGAELLLQEYIPIDFDIRTLVLNNSILGSTKRSKVERDFRTNLSLGGETSPYKLSTKEKEIVLKVAKSLNGYFLGVDHILDGDNIFVLESNGSPGTLSIFEDLSGKKISRGKIIEKIVSSAADKSTWKGFNNENEN
jgi:ribosomal protein S6--L-glutamate ligase